MKRNSVCFIPIVNISSDDWLSDTDFSENESHPVYEEETERNPGHQSAVMKEQYFPSPESTKERKIFITDKSDKRKLCHSCRSKKTGMFAKSTESLKEEFNVQSADSKVYNDHKQNKYSKERDESNFYSDYLGKEKILAENEDSVLSFKFAPMKPVTPDVRKEIYKGISHEGNGCSKYLNMRCYKSPEERWYHPVTSAMEYGWTWGFPPTIKNPEYGRKSYITHSFYRRNGTQLKPEDDSF